MELISALIEIVRRLARDAGPYLLVEILLPGGSLLAVALFVYRRRESFPSLLSISLAAKRLEDKQLNRT
jgi:hypothetical protein